MRNWLRLTKGKVRGAPRAKGMSVGRHVNPIKRSQRVQRMNNFGVEKARYLLILPLLLAAIFSVSAIRGPRMNKMQGRPVEEVLVNPMMGWAVDAAAPPANEGDYSMVYAEVSWRELETEPGVYDFEAFERRVQMDKWAALGKKMVIRFVMDCPQSQGIDIPDWLYDETGGDGEWYTTQEGSGFSPDYTNRTLIDRHYLVLEALGRRYDSDRRIAWVELGSLGHDGSWRVDRAEGVDPLPLSDIVTEYVWHYTRAFPNTRLLMSRPFSEAHLLSLGLYNDNLGDEDKSWEWLDFVRFGGYDDQLSAMLRPMEDFWKRGASVAHLDRGQDQAVLLREKNEQILRQIKEGHLSIVAGLDPALFSDPELKEALDQAAQSMGYRLWVLNAKWPRSLRAGYRLRVETLWRNDGSAPMYENWPVELSLARDGEVVVKQNTDLKTCELLPGESERLISLDIPSDLEEGVYTLCVAILDPETGQPGVRLAMEGAREDGRCEMGQVEIFH